MVTITATDCFNQPQQQLVRELSYVSMLLHPLTLWFQPVCYIMHDYLRSDQHFSTDQNKYIKQDITKRSPGKKITSQMSIVGNLQYYV